MSEQRILYVSVREAARMTGLHRNHLDRAIAKGVLERPRRVGNKSLLNVRALEKWINGHPPYVKESRNGTSAPSRF